MTVRSIHTQGATMEAERQRRMARTLAIAQAYASQEPVEEIAQTWKCAQATVVNIAKRMGIPLRYKRDCSPEKKAAVVRRYVAGEKVKAIAKEENVDRKTIWAWALEAGVPLRRPELKRRTA